MFAVDDLRAEFGTTYGAPQVLAPNIDELAGRSNAVHFRKAYVQYAHCVVSRASILTSRRPNQTHGKTGNPFGVGSCARGSANYTTLPTYFREHGYNTAGSGKVSSA
jgi:iduronate 2-sulfatase